MNEVVVAVPTGCIGNRGVHRASFMSALADERPHAIAVDAGSLDPGPWYLGAGREHSPARTIRWDLELLLGAAATSRIPLIIGTAGGSGARAHVDTAAAEIRAIAERNSLRLNLAVIHADVDSGYLRGRCEAETIEAVDHEGDLEPAAVDEASTVVAMMGAEPLIEALDQGADVVLAGRASDTAVIGAFPIRAGVDPGLAYHLGDVLECGESAAVEIAPVLHSDPHNRIAMVGRMRGDHFVVRPSHPSLACTPASCSGHSLYERARIDSTLLPGGCLDKSAARYRAEDARTTRIEGAVFHPADPYTVLLEGVRPVGHRSVLIFGVRTPRMLERLDDILEAVRAQELELFSDVEGLQIHYHVYGRDGVLGPYEREARIAHEAGVVVDVVAPTQAIANEVAEDLRCRASFVRYPGRQTTAGNTATLFSPGVFDVGIAYDLHIYHALPVRSPTELFPIQMERL